MYLQIFKVNIIDSIMSKNSTYNEVFNTFKKYIICLIANILFKQIFQIVDYFFIRNYTNKYKCILLKKIVEKDISFFDIFTTGELISKIEYCENNIQEDFVFK